MKQKLLSIFFILLIGLGLSAQSVGVNTTSPDPSAALDITSTTKGMLVPRMDSLQRTMIELPATGLMVYQTNANPAFYYYNGTAWTMLSTGGASELQKIAEASSTGWRILGRDTANYGNIGQDAVDLSISASSSSNRGATGENSTAMGSHTTASGTVSTAMGASTIAEGAFTTAMGNLTKALGNNSTAMGAGTIASGESSVTMGDGTIAQSYGELAVGVYNDTLLATDAFYFASDTNRVFTVGNGYDNARNTAFVIQQNGNVGINQRRPSEKLDIAGSIKIVDGTQGAGKVLTSDANGKASWQTAASGGGASELQKITEGDNTGWRILGRDTATYGNIGPEAIDLSFSFNGSTTRGATGAISTAMGGGTTASGTYSTAMGNSTTASGDNSTAMGNFTTATGNYSTAMGSGTAASGSNSTAMGENTTASGTASTAMGGSTVASALYSTAMGGSTQASGTFSTAMGASTTASGLGSTAMGNLTIASGNWSIAMGASTTAKSYAEIALGALNTNYLPLGTSTFHSADRAFGVGIGASATTRKDGLIVYKNGTLWLDTLTAAPTPTANRLYVLNKKLHYNGAEVGAGGASELQKITEGINTGWRLLGRDPENFGDIGQDAVDLSYTITGTTYGATGNYSTAMGLRATASGEYSTAMGLNNIASGNGSTAMGSSTTASGAYTTAMGSASSASGFASTAMNVATKALGTGSTAMGSYTSASGDYSTSMGDSTLASGIYSVAGGKRTFARSYAETSVGSYNTDYFSWIYFFIQCNRPCLWSWYR